MSLLNIPDKITVGFNRRTDTFTGKLGFVVFKDKSGKLRKEKSFNNWIDKSIEVMEFDNIPQDGYILNKDISRNTYSNYKGRSIFRVYDPRGFEFEITPENLMNILANTDSSRNEIKDKCIFAWIGAELVLLTENSLDYQEYLESKLELTHTPKKGFSLKDLEKGKVYACNKKDSNNYLYIGYFPFQNNTKSRTRFPLFKEIIKKHHVFYDSKYNNFVSLSSQKISHVVEGKSAENLSKKYSNKLNYFKKSIFSSPFLSSKEEAFNFDIINKTIEEVGDINVFFFHDENKYKLTISNKKESKYSFINSMKNKLLPYESPSFESELIFNEDKIGLGFGLLNMLGIQKNEIDGISDIFEENKLRKIKLEEIKKKFEINNSDKNIMFTLKDKIDFLNFIGCKLEIFKVSDNECKIIY